MSANLELIIYSKELHDEDEIEPEFGSFVDYTSKKTHAFALYVPHAQYLFDEFDLPTGLVSL